VSACAFARKERKAGGSRINVIKSKKPTCKKQQGQLKGWSLSENQK